MTTLLLIRHGQSMTNLDKTFTGQYDAALTELGREQAEHAADYIVANYKVDKIYASDLKRAFDTGAAVAKRIHMEIIPDKNLREIHGGQWHNMKYTQIAEQFPKEYHAWMHDIGTLTCPDGESVGELNERCMAEFRKIAEENRGQTVVIATHATPIRVLQTLCEGKTLREMNAVPWVSNASVTVAEYENGEFRLKLIGEDSYLGQMKTQMPKGI